ncbi:MAG TPA: hypothetical protein VHX11_12465 [Acidobacteriaceae bacterium]|nr:hypothetical protein [Acidobacteriaceae bacterium]
MPEQAPNRGHAAVWVWTVGLFLALWVVLYCLNVGLPYLKNGSDIVFNAKLQFEQTSQLFPADRSISRVLIFGNSKVLAGFLPSLFDQMAASHGLRVSSYNSGFPGSDVFLPQLKTLCERGQAPDVLLLTLPWDTVPPRDVFHLVADDHAVIQDIFPFRFFVRDAVSFGMSAAGHGGFRSFYRESKENERQMIADRGYFEISEQSRFAGGRLPDDFHLASDRPDKRDPRIAPPQSPEIGELNSLLRQYRIRCYYVPYYLRIGEAAPAAARDLDFAAVVEKVTPCKVLGGDYFLYPNRLFSDQTHLNTDGARVYTAALFGVVQNELAQGNSSALQ